MACASFPASLALHGQDTVQGGGGDPQALGGGNVILHGLVDAVAADHQHMGPAQVVPRHIQPVLVFLGNLVFEEGRQEQHRADGRIPGVVHLTTVGRSVLGVLILAVAPGSRNVGKRSFHGKILSPGVFGQQKSGCLPAACVHIVVNLCGVVVADRGRRIKQHRKQILLHVADFGGIVPQAFHDKLDVGAIQLQKTGADHLMGEVAASDPGGFPLGADGLHHQLHNLVQILPVGGKLPAQVVILDVLQNQIPIIFHL